MNRRDWDLLDKQMHELPQPPRHDGTMILAIVAVFFVGISLGGYLFGSNNSNGTTQVASNAPALNYLQTDRR